MNSIQLVCIQLLCYHVVSEDPFSIYTSRLTDNRPHIHMSYLVVDQDLEEDVPVTVSVVDLQHRRVACGLRAVVHVAELLLAQLLQLEAAERPLAVQASQVAVTRRLQHQNQHVGRVVWVFDVQGGLGDDGLVTGAVH